MGDDRRPLAVLVQRHEQLALVEGGEELGPGAPDSSGACGGLHDAGGRAQGGAVHELADPVLVVLRPGPLDRRGVVRLDDADGPAGEHDRRGGGEDVARREAVARHPLADEAALRVLVHEAQPRLPRLQLVGVGDQRPAGPVEREPAEAEQPARGRRCHRPDAPGGALLLGESQPVRRRVLGEQHRGARGGDREPDDEHPGARKPGDRLFGPGAVRGPGPEHERPVGCGERDPRRAVGRDGQHRVGCAGRPRHVLGPRGRRMTQPGGEQGGGDRDRERETLHTRDDTPEVLSYSNLT